jgi:hypothetical protein
MTHLGPCGPEINLSSHSRAVLRSRSFGPSVPRRALDDSRRVYFPTPRPKRAPRALKRRVPLCPFHGCTLPVWRKTGVCVNHAGAGQ